MPKYGPRVMCRLCKTIIQSKHVHDFVSCACKDGGIFIDGGGEYTRCGGEPRNFVWIDKETDETNVEAS